MSGYRQHQDQEGQLGVPSQQLHDAFDLYFESKSGIRMGRNFSFANGPFKCIFPSARQSPFRSQLLVENCYVPGVSTLIYSSGYGGETNDSLIIVEI